MKFNKLKFNEPLKIWHLCNLQTLHNKRSQAKYLYSKHFYTPFFQAVYKARPSHILE